MTDNNSPQLVTEIWNELLRAVPQRRDPFHSPVVASAGTHGVDARVVILRRVTPERRELTFHTDIRGQKIADFQQTPELAWVFYDPARKLQIRAKGTLRVHTQDDITRAAWETTKLMSRRAYLTEFGSGTVLDQPQSGLSPEMEDRSPTLAESEAGYANFAVCVTTVTRLERLHLAARGHQRAVFNWNVEKFEGAWLAP